MVNVWKKPTFACYRLEELESTIKVKAWSTGSAMELGAFLDSCNQGMVGTVQMYDPENNLGYIAQAKIISKVFVLGYIVVEFLETEKNRRYTYKKPQFGGDWFLYSYT